MKRNDHRLLLTLPSLVVSGFFVAALLSFIGISFLRLDPGGSSFLGPPGLANYIEALRSDYFWRVAAQTFAIALEVTVLAVVIGFPLAYVLARSSSSAVRRTILFSLVATFLSGGVTRAYAWMVILGNRGVVNGLLANVGIAPLQLINNQFAVVVSVLNFALPFFVFTLFGALQAIPESLEHASRNLGASRLRTFASVTLPLSLPGLVAAGSLVFAIALAAFLFPELLGGGRVHVSATSIFEKIQTNYDIPAAAALSVLFLVLTALAFTAFGLLQRFMAARSQPGASA